MAAAPAAGKPQPGPEPPPETALCSLDVEDLSQRVQHLHQGFGVGQHRSLAGQPHFFAVVFLFDGVVVVAVDAFHPGDVASDPFAQAAPESVHHFFTVQLCESLCPVQFGQVIIELGGSFL